MIAPDLRNGVEQLGAMIAEAIVMATRDTYIGRPFG